MKANTGITLLAAVAAVVALCVVLLRTGDAEMLLVKLPEWMDPDVIAAKPVPKPLVPEEDSHIRAMMPPQKLAKAMNAVQQTVTIDVQAIANTGITAEVGAGMVRTMEQFVAVSYPILMEKSPNSRRMRYVDFVMSWWPQVADLIETGKLKPKVDRVEPDALKTVMLLGDMRKKTLTVQFVTQECWRVSFEFKNDASNPSPELYRLIWEAKVE